MNKFLAVDISWLYCKYYYVNKDKEYKDSAIYGVTYFLYLLHRNIKDFKHIFFVLDGENSKKELYEDYKSGRKDKTDVYKNFQDFLKLLSLFPCSSIIKNNKEEADTVIAYLAINYSRKNKVLIYSGDKDFWQLKSENISISSTYKEGKFVEVTDKDIFDKFGVYPNELLKYRTFKGDPSDKIPPAIPRLSSKKIHQILDVWEEDNLDQDILAQIIMKLDDKDLEVKIMENFQQVLVNYKLQNLTSCANNVKLKEGIKKIVYDINKEEINNLLDKYDLIKYRNFEGKL